MKKVKYKIISKNCPACNEPAESIGVFIKKNLLGSMGLRCPHCGKVKKANSEKIEPTLLPLVRGESKFRVEKLSD